MTKKEWTKITLKKYVYNNIMTVSNRDSGNKYLWQINFAGGKLVFLRNQKKNRHDFAHGDLVSSGTNQTAKKVN